VPDLLLDRLATLITTDTPLVAGHGRRPHSKHPAHAALVSEADFIAAQDMTAPRGRSARRYAGTCSPGCWHRRRGHHRL